MQGILQIFTKEKNTLFLINKLTPVPCYRLLLMSFCDIHRRSLPQGWCILNLQGIDAKYRAGQAQKNWLLNSFWKCILLVNAFSFNKLQKPTFGRQFLESGQCPLSPTLLTA